MTEFVRQDLSGAFFDDVDLSNARFRNVLMRDVVIRGTMLLDVEISGELQNVRVNGIDIAPYVEAELLRRNPDLAKMKPADAAGFREAWEILERLWGETVARARTYPESALHQRVDGEWSFIENLRHLVFATDAWVRRAILGDPSPWDPLDLPHDDMADEPSVPRDRSVRPSLDEVLALRADRMETVRTLLATIGDEVLDEMTTPVTAPGYPKPNRYPIRGCLLSILNEEWWHRQYVERGLNALRSDASSGA